MNYSRRSSPFCSSTGNCAAARSSSLHHRSCRKGRLPCDALRSDCARHCSSRRRSRRRAGTFSASGGHRRDSSRRGRWRRRAARPHRYCSSPMRRRTSNPSDGTPSSIRWVRAPTPQPSSPAPSGRGIRSSLARWRRQVRSSEFDVRRIGPCLFRTSNLELRTCFSPTGAPWPVKSRHTGRGCGDGWRNWASSTRSSAPNTASSPLMTRGCSSTRRSKPRCVVPIPASIAQRSATTVGTRFCSMSRGRRRKRARRPRPGATASSPRAGRGGTARR